MLGWYIRSQVAYASSRMTPVKLSRERWDILVDGRLGYVMWGHVPLVVERVIEKQGVTFLPADYVCADSPYLPRA